MQVDPTTGSISVYLERLKCGDDDAVQQLWRRYSQSLAQIADGRLRPAVRGGFDGEDVVVSVFDAFVRNARSGRFPELADRDGLWRMLLTMTLRKASTKAANATRMKRGGGGVLRHSDLPMTALPAASVDNVHDDALPPDVLVAMRDELEALFRRLKDPTLQQIALGKMDGYTDEELATQHHCARRTIVRKLALIRSIWKEASLADHQ